MRKCWYDSLSVISDALILTQNYELSNACDNGRLEDARSAFQRGADPYWRTPNPVSLRLVHSFSCTCVSIVLLVNMWWCSVHRLGNMLCTGMQSRMSQ